MVASDCFVSVVAPLGNDAEIVEEFVTETLAVLGAHYANYELTLVDDGSQDDTVERVKRLLPRERCIRLIRLSRRFGEEIAISAGLDSVIGDFVVVMLPDTDPPALIPRIVEQSRRGSGVVFGIRASRRGEPAILRAGAAFFYWFADRILGLGLPRNSTHFRVLSRQAVNAVIQIKDRFRYLRTLSAYVGYDNQSFVYETISRRARPQRKSLWEAANLGISIIVSNTAQPLRLVSWLGLLISALDLLYIGYIVLVYLFKPHVAEGWTTESLQSAIMFFFVFVMLTAICEYLGRLLGESRDRPLYFVMAEHNSSVLMADAERRNVVGESVELTK
jgi:dolichol-phosphate mannosyltransferase